MFLIYCDHISSTHLSPIMYVSVCPCVCRSVPGLGGLGSQERQEERQGGYGGGREVARRAAGRLSPLDVLQVGYLP
jgi:hypothetical protein